MANKLATNQATVFMGEPGTEPPTIFDGISGNLRPVTQHDVDELAQYRLAFDGLNKNLRHLIAANHPQAQQIANALEVARRALERDTGDAPPPEDVEAAHLKLHPGVRHPEFVQSLDALIEQASK